MLLQLPIELILNEILPFCDDEDVMKISATCRHFRLCIRYNFLFWRKRGNERICNFVDLLMFDVCKTYLKYRNIDHIIEELGFVKDEKCAMKAESFENLKRLHWEKKIKGNFYYLIRHKNFTFIVKNFEKMTSAMFSFYVCQVLDLDNKKIKTIETIDIINEFNGISVVFRESDELVCSYKNFDFDKLTIILLEHSPNKKLSCLAKYIKTHKIL